MTKLLEDQLIEWLARSTETLNPVHSPDEIVAMIRSRGRRRRIRVHVVASLAATLLVCGVIGTMNRTRSGETTLVSGEVEPVLRLLPKVPVGARMTLDDTRFSRYRRLGGDLGENSW